MFDTHVSDVAFAIWTVGTQSELDVHINEWIMPNSCEMTAFIDFGIRIYNVKGVDSVGLFVPYPIEDHEIVDLAKCLGNEDIARGIFNTTCTVTTHGETGIIDLDYNHHKSNVATLPRSVIKTSSSTTIYFDLNSVANNITRDEFYIRFRIPEKKLGELLNQRKKFFRSFTSLLASPIEREYFTYIIRVNEMRVLPNEIRFNQDVQRQKINKIIIAMALNGLIKVDSSFCYKVRVIEQKLYKDYVPKNFHLESCMAYQWLSQKNAKTHYNFTLTLRKENINIYSLLIYSIFVIILSALGGLLVEFIKLLVF